MGHEVWQEYRSRNLNPRWQKYSMRSHAFQREWACYSRVTGSWEHTQHVSFLIVTNSCSLLWKGVVHSSGNQCRNQQNAGKLARLCRDCWRIRPGHWWSDNWGTHRMHADSVWWQWLEDMTGNIKTLNNPGCMISNSDLEMAGLLLLWLAMEGVCGTLREKWVMLLSNNSPMVGWVERLALKWSTVAKHLIQALAMYLKTNQTCPITPMHIPGHQHTIANVLSCSFGSHLAWHCATVS